MSDPITTPHFVPAYRVEGPFGPKGELLGESIEMTFSIAPGAPNLELGTSAMEKWGLSKALTQAADVPSPALSFCELLLRTVELFMGKDDVALLHAKISDVARSEAKLISEFYNVGETAKIFQQSYIVTTLFFCERNPFRPNAQEIRNLLAPKDGLSYIRRAAKHIFIPIVELGMPSVFQLGYGAVARIQNWGGSDRDSAFGHQMQRNKALTNSFLKRAGYPGVEHELVASEEEAFKAARKLGYPLVVKPLDSSNGHGVSADITSELSLADAYRGAAALSPGRVLVEKFVAGADCRLMVLAGKFVWARRRFPAQVIGDGVTTVYGLIEVENARRRASDEDSNKVIVVNEALETFLTSKGLSLKAQPEENQNIVLEKSYTTRLGTALDVTDEIHADNIKFAEEIASLFRLSNIGIDFICEDIKTSWKYQRCAVIEVNASPIIPSERYAMLYLQSLFGLSKNARIPATLIVTDRVDFGRAVWTRSDDTTRMGYCDDEGWWLGSNMREQRGRTPRDALTSILINPSCESVLVSKSPSDLAQRGLPLDWFETCIIDARVSLPPKLLALLSRCSGAVTVRSP